MSVQEIKKKIKKKFGTYSRFCAIVGLDRYAFQKNFLTANKVSLEDRNYIDGLADQHEYKPAGKVLTEAKLVLIRSKLAKEGGVLAFCEKNPEFVKRTVFHILSENGEVKKITPMVRKLMDALGVK